MNTALVTLDPKDVTKYDYTWYFLLRKTPLAGDHAFWETTNVWDIADNDIIVSVIHNGVFCWMDEMATQFDGRFDIEAGWLKV